MNKKTFVLKFVLIGLLVVLVACAESNSESVPAATATTEATPMGQRVIVLGDISDDPAEVIEGTQPLADYIAERLSNFGVIEGRVKIAATADEMAQLLASGEVDLYFDSVYPATLVSDSSGGKIILRRWRYGVEEYQSVIFTSVDSGITSIDDLHGHLIAFDNQFSTSGFVLPAVYLQEEGINLVGKHSYNDPIGEDELGFVFSYDDENTLQWILSGFVTVGATDDYNFDKAFPEDITANLVELARTERVPRQVAVVTPQMDSEMLELLIQILITAHETERGQAVLEPFQTTKFDHFPEGIEAASDHMRDMAEIIESIPMP